MCGIVGYVGKKSVVPVIIEGCGGWSIAATTLPESRCAAMAKACRFAAPKANCAIWKKSSASSRSTALTASATPAGPPTAAPRKRTPTRIAIAPARIVVVHNGIIENYVTLKKKLIEEGHKFTTETDTEIIAHLVEKYYLKTGNGHRPSLEEAVRKTVKELTGVFALAVIAVDDPNKIVAARNGPPAVIGLGKDEYFVASDVPAILYHTRDLFFLADGDLAVITPEGVQTHRLQRPAHRSPGAAHHLGPDHGGKGRVQAFHAQGNL